MSFNDGFNIRSVPWPPNTPVSGYSLVYNGTQWVAADVSGSGGGGTGDITAVNAGTNMTGGGDTGDVTISLSSSVTGLNNLQTTTLTASSANILGNLVVSGTITAFEYYTQVVTASVIYQSGSTKFGDDSADTHQFSGSILLSGTLTANNSISGTNAQFISLTASNFQVENDLYVSGGLTVGKYVQLLPVSGNTIPTNQTASYIYTSGSTNDLYFTQYQPGTNFTNTTRLRWLESTLSTGLLHGGVLSTVNGTTTFSLTSGSGLIVTYNASIDSDPYPTIQLVNWPAYVSQSLNYVTASQISYISVDQDGEILQSPTPPTFAQYKDRIVIGRILHQSGSVANGATNTPPTAYGLATSAADFIRAIGPLKINGHFLAASGSTLGLTKTAGDAYVEGRNYAGNPNIPNIILAADDPSVTISKIYRVRISGSQPVIDTGVAGAGYTAVDPTKYQDANGNLQTVGNFNFSVQRVFWFPKAVNRALFVYYGQALYSNLDDAIAGISTENFTEGENTKGSAILVGFLVMRGNISNFNTTNTARIYQASTFRGGGGGGSGTSGGGTTLPAGSSSYVQFNDVGSFGADSRFTFDKITHTLTVTGTGSFSQLSTSGPSTLGTVSGTTAQFTTVTASNFVGTLIGTASFATTAATASSNVYTREWHVSTGSGNDATGNGTLLSPYRTVAAAIAAASTQGGDQIVIHPGSYFENVTMGKSNTTICAAQGSNGGEVNFSGTMTISQSIAPNSSIRLFGIAVSNLIHNGTGSLYLDTCKVDNFTKTTNTYCEINDSDINTTLTVNGSGILAINGGKQTQTGTFTINNPLATVSVKNSMNCTAPVVNAGFFGAEGSTIYSKEAGYAVSASAATRIDLVNCYLITPAGTPASASMPLQYSIANTVYNKTGSILGTSLNLISDFQTIRADTGSFGTIAYTPANASHWSGSAPTTIKEAVDRMASLLAILNSGSIP
jgi:hypothetical protein